MSAPKDLNPYDCRAIAQRQGRLVEDITKEDDGVEVFGYLIRGTAKASLIEIGGEQIWLPKSQIFDKKLGNTPDDECCFTIATWLAKKHNLC